MRYESVAKTLKATIATAILAGTGIARADAPASGGKVAAEALFERGRALVAEGNYSEACPKFADSERLDPSSSTLLNLASCLEKLGRTATAWATYREAASAASTAGRKDNLTAAQRHADALAPRLAHVTVVVTSPVEGLKTTRDGLSVGRGEWGVSIPVDTGAHAFEATAPGHKTWTSSIDVPRDGVETTVTVPALEESPIEPPPPAASAPAPVPAGSAPANVDTGMSWQRALGLTIAGAGVVGVGVGTVFAVRAKGKYDDSLGHCETISHDLCDPQGVALRDDARSAGDVATLAVGLGAAAIVAGGVLWFTGPRSPPDAKSGARWTLGPTIGGAFVKGAW